MKSKMLLIAMVVACAAIATSGSYAYFVTQDRVHNVITTDSVKIEVEHWLETNEGLIPDPAEPIQVMPGITVKKVVTVKNKEAESYIRAKYELLMKDAEGRIIELTSEELGEKVQFVMNQTDWVRKTDDSEWWYYKHGVATDASTNPMFTGISFDGANITNEYQNCTVEMKVKAQAVQIANNGNSAVEATGWPAG